MKKLLCVVSLAVLLCFTFACQNKAEKAELEKFKAQVKVEEENVALVKHHMEAINERDLDALGETVAPEMAWYLPSTRISTKSREQYIEFSRAFLKAFPDLVVSIEEAYAVGDRVIMRYVMRATQQGEWGGVPATGNKVEASGTFISRIENGKIVDRWEDFDVLGMYEQMGMELKPKEVKK